MSWELSRRRIVRTVNEKFIFGRIVRPPAVNTLKLSSSPPPSSLSGRCWTLPFATPQSLQS